MNVIHLKPPTIEPPPFRVPTEFEVEFHSHDWFCIFATTKTIDFRESNSSFATAIVYELDLDMLNKLAAMKSAFLNESTDAGCFLCGRKYLFDPSSSVLRFVPRITKNFKSKTNKVVLVTEIFPQNSKSNEETEALTKLILNRLNMEYGSLAYIIFEPDDV